MQFNRVKRSAAYIRIKHAIGRVLTQRQSSEVPVVDDNRSTMFLPRSPERIRDRPAAEEIGTEGDGLLLGRQTGSSGDHVIRSLCCALDAAELEHDAQCVEALTRAIEARLAGLRPVNAQDHGDAASNRPRVRALQKWRLKRVVEHVDANLSSKISLLDLAAVAGLSRMHFACQFRAATGLRPHEFLLQRRICRSKELMKGTSMTIAEIALTVGFLTQAHFTTVFKRFVGYTPRQWRTANQIASVPRTQDAGRSERRTAL